MKPWEPLDPRLHLGAAIGWAVFLVVMLFAIGAGAFAAAKTESEVRSEAESLLVQFATGIGYALQVDLATRRQIVRAAAAQLSISVDGGDPALRESLEATQRQFPEFGWLGVAGRNGRIVAATHDLGLGQEVSAVATLPSSADAVELAVPVGTSGERAAGVLIATLPWSWIDRRMTELLAALDPQRRLGLDASLAAGDRIVLGGPPAWRERALTPATDLSERGTFLVGRAAVVDASADGNGPAWTLIVRQQAEAAVARAQTIGHAVFLSVLGAGLLAAAIAVAAVRMLIRRLTRLAEQAQAVQHGTSQRFAAPAGKDEVSRIGAVLVQVMQRLQHEKRTLEQLNVELDQRVAERTARIEHLADDARHAAVTRERLRLARDLHDTLAHSMMALLTQLRLVRKLRTRWSEDELEQELERAESVAASGLAEARAAINHMRRNGVRETGLGTALQDLLRRFRERTGLDATLRIEGRTGELADERAGTAFRIVEEALYNVERHAQAHAVTLSLEPMPPSSADDGDADAPRARRVRLELADDGIGFDPAQRPPGHFGLRGMQEQAALIGARLELISRPGHGARMVLEFDSLG